MRFEMRSFDSGDFGPEDDPPAAALRVVPGDDLHPEDAFLHEFQSFLRRTLSLGAPERAVAEDLARDALERADGPEGDFTRLPVERWLVAAMPSRARHGVDHAALGRLALAFVTFLRVTGRVSLPAARRLGRAIAGLGGRPVARAA